MEDSKIDMFVLDDEVTDVCEDLPPETTRKAVGYQWPGERMVRELAGQT